MRFVKFFVVLLIFTSLCLGQLLKTSRDSLFIFPAHPENVMDWPIDTIFVYNIGNQTLIIDKLLSKHEFSYPLTISSKDTSIFYYVLNGIPLNFSIAAGDSAMLVFSSPDLCPICKTTTDSMTGNFEDSIYIYSNSIDGGPKILYATGIGMETGIEDQNLMPLSAVLIENFPNPFNETTTIRFRLPEAAEVEIMIVDLNGRMVERLLKKKMPSGQHQITWQARNFASGIYFCRLRTAKINRFQKMILIK